MELMGIAPVAAITAICYLIGEGVKLAPIDNKWIPVICGTFGLILGLASIFIMPEFATYDYITAAATGTVSGLAATGINQIGKQLG